MILLNSSCASVRQASLALQRKLKRSSGFCPFIHKSRELLYGLKERSQIISALEMYLLYFGCFSLIRSCKKVSFERSGRRLKIAAVKKSEDY